MIWTGRSSSLLPVTCMVLIVTDRPPPGSTESTLPTKHLRTASRSALVRGSSNPFIHKTLKWNSDNYSRSGVLVDDVCCCCMFSEGHGGILIAAGFEKVVPGDEASPEGASAAMHFARRPAVATVADRITHSSVAAVARVTVVRFLCSPMSILYLLA